MSSHQSDSINGADANQLHELGYEPVLQRRFSRLSLLATGFCILNTWQALGSTLSLSLFSGGPSSILWGSLVGMGGNTLLALSMAEFVAAWPTSCGSYHWVVQLIPKGTRGKREIVWFVGWSNLIAWYMMAVSACILAAQCYMSCATVLNTNFSPKNYQTYLLYLALVFTATIFNTFCLKWIPIYTKVSMYWSILAFILFIILISALSDGHASAKWVFTGHGNESGFGEGLAWLLGFVQSAALCFTGYDSIVHLVEELPDPTRSAPFAIIATPIIGGLTGFAFLIALLFQVTDIEGATSSYMALTYIALQTKGGVALAVILTLFIAIGLTVGTYLDILTCSRLTYVLARDHGLPSYFDNVSGSEATPIRAVWSSGIIVGILGVVSVINNTAFAALLNGTVIFINFSYAFPPLLLLFLGRKSLPSTRAFKLTLPGGSEILGYAINILAVFYGFATFGLSFCPTSKGGFNWVIVVYGVVYAVGIIYWFGWGYRKFIIPKWVGGNLDFNKAGHISSTPIGASGGDAEQYGEENHVTHLKSSDEEISKVPESSVNDAKINDRQ